MKYNTEIIIGYNDMPLPSEELFLPSVWANYELWEIKSDGDYYYLDNEDGLWSYLNFDSKNKNFFFNFALLRPNPKYWISEISDQVVSYLDGKSLDTIATLSIKTDEEDLYEEFLDTVLMFLEYTKGIVLNLEQEYDAKFFKKKFISK